MIDDGDDLDDDNDNDNDDGSSRVRNKPWKAEQFYLNPTCGIRIRLISWKLNIPN